VAFGTGSVNATTSGFSMPGNSQVFVASSDAITHVAAITASGSTTLRISRGDGGV
jgi:hypothetical protein